MLSPSYCHSKHEQQTEGNSLGEPFWGEVSMLFLCIHVIKYNHYIFKINCSAITMGMWSAIQILKPWSLRKEKKETPYFLRWVCVFRVQSLLPALDNGNVKMQNFRMRLLHACFWFGRQRMKGYSTGWKGLSCTIKPLKEDFESLQSSAAFLKCRYLHIFLHISSLERKILWDALDLLLFWSSVDIGLCGNGYSPPKFIKPVKESFTVASAVWCQRARCHEALVSCLF